MNAPKILTKKASAILRHVRIANPARIGIMLLLLEVFLLIIYITLNVQSNIPLMLAAILCITSIVFVFYGIKHAGKY